MLVELISPPMIATGVIAAVMLGILLWLCVKYK